MNIRLDGKWALVCGASKGIGAETARVLAEQGAKVVLLARDEKGLEQVRKSLMGTDHQTVALDLSDSDRLRSVAEQLAKDHPIEILVNNSGGPKAGAILDASPEEFLAAMKGHILPAQILVQKLLPGMKARHYGRIINVISTSVKIPLANLGVSNTIRGAMANWSKTMANELGVYGVTVNNVLPGFTKTERLDSLKAATAEKQGKSQEEIEKEWIQSVPLKRLAEPREIASAIAFLASPAAGYVNGINLPVDGGRLGSL